MIMQDRGVGRLKVVRGHPHHRLTEPTVSTNNGTVSTCNYQPMKCWNCPNSTNSH